MRKLHFPFRLFQNSKGKPFFWFFLMIGLISFSEISLGFIPPVAVVLKEIFEGRKRAEGTEVIFHHRLAGGNGDIIELEERIIAERGREYFSWRVSGASAPGAAVLEKRTYHGAGDKKWNAHSNVFLKYFTTPAFEDFRDTLLAEHFIKRDQFKQFKEGFTPTGDPQTWDIKGNYVDQDSISLAHLTSGVAIAVVGTEGEETRKTVYFDKGLLGLRRLEWRENGESYAWNFDTFSKMGDGGQYPRRISFTRGKTEIISSELSLVRPLTAKQKLELIKVWQKTGKGQPYSPVLEEALKVLLSYR